MVIKGGKLSTVQPRRLDFAGQSFDPVAMDAMIRSGALRGFAPLVERLGGAPGPLLRAHGITAEALADEDALVSLRATGELLEAAAQRLDCPDFGLQLAGTQDISILGPLAVAMQHSATVADALRCATRYLFVHSPAIALTPLIDSPREPGMSELRISYLVEGMPEARQGIELSLGVMHRILQFLGRSHYRLQLVTLPHTPLAPMVRYARFFGAEVRAADPFAALFIRPIDLDTPLAEVNDALRQLAAHHLESHYARPGESTSARVRLAISHSLSTGGASRDRVAAMLALHPRTLRRRLADEGSSFEDIRDAVARETALRYLTTTDLPMSQIADLVGLSEQSALTRACRRWFGAAPSAIRRDGAPSQAAARAAAGEPSR
jgi:AraC-like DNA-binding protein